MKAVVSLSGGLDSTSVLHHLMLSCSGGDDLVRAVFFNYGSKHNPHELKAVQKIVDFYRQNGATFLQLDVIDVSGAFSLMESNLMARGGEIPEGHYEQENMKLTVVPGRNSIFISILTGIAESIGADYVALGIHQGDHAIYPDCRKEYFESMATSMLLASDGKVRLIAPFLEGNKTDIVRWGLANGVPYELTRTCYKAQEAACGKCGSCTERLEAFRDNHIEDPAPYVK